MHVVVLGAAGMLGRRLSREIARRYTGLSRLTLIDIVKPPDPDGYGADCLALDYSDADVAAKIADGEPDQIFHLAAVVSGEAESNFDKGYKVNFTATENLLRAIRNRNIHPRIVFASSLAVFGPPFPDPVPDSHRPTPASSYGTQKAMTEFLIADYTRKGFIDGISLRLPTAAIRPGKPNAAASGFLSNIIREPLQGLPAFLPVPVTTRAYLSSPNTIVRSFVMAASLPADKLKGLAALNLPGLTVSVEDMLQTLRDVAGQTAVDLVTPRRDPLVSMLVESWPPAFEARTARGLGFPVNESFREIVQEHINEYGMKANSQKESN